MSYEDEDDWDDEPEDNGPLTPVATYMTVHEAELARSKLESEGFYAVLWDAHTVSADPLLALAVHGVKVMVAKRFVVRAAAVLAHRARAFGVPPRPVFRVRAPRGKGGVAVSLLLGLALGAGLVLPFESPLPLAVGLLVGALGHWIATKLRTDYCSGCSGILPDVDVASCPGCLLLVRGTIAHPDERLAAEERCEEDAR